MQILWGIFFKIKSRQMDEGLSYLLTLQGIYLITAEDEDLVVAENLLRGRVSVLGGGELHKQRAHDRAQ